MTQEPKRQVDWDILGRLDERTQNICDEQKTLKENLKEHREDFKRHCEQERQEWEGHVNKLEIVKTELNGKVEKLELLANRVKWTMAVIVAIPATLAFTKDWIVKGVKKIFSLE